MSKNLLLLLFIMLIKKSYGQIKITGQVVEITDSKEAFLPGANVFWLDGTSGTVTDISGHFEIEVPDSLPRKLAIGLIGYKTDTVLITNTESLIILLEKSFQLNPVEINARQDAINISTIKPLNVEKITHHELLKAACCNLSEAFETNPSVNVAYKDAVTGVKEIHLLGLGGTYVQMLSENIPDMRGLAGIYGLTFVPGPWIESIQLTKGSGSVINGYESTTGQINLEYKKPLDRELPRLFLNLFADEYGGTEANAIFKNSFDSRLSTLLFVHGKTMTNEVDRNSDGFMDVPDNRTFNIFNRWEYHDNEKLEAQLALKYLEDDIDGGQTMDVKTAPLYLTHVNTKRAEISGKLGFIFPEKPLKSIGNIFQLTYHDMQSSFGLKTYDAKESSFYFQSIYQNILWKPNHKFRTGVSYRYNVLDQQFPGLPDKVVENIPGVFFEYTYNYLEKLTLIAGVREDLQREKSWVFIPRFHGKYNFTEDFIFRFSAGKSYRIPYLIADHISVLASSRIIDITENINPEEAWNYGVNFTKRTTISGHEVSFSADAYRTNFINQLVLDAYSDSTKISFYNLDGSSYSNSLQFTLNVEVIKMMNLRLAYKFDDVRSTFEGKTEEQPLISKNRFLGTISYSTLNEHWKFDYTFVWEGRKKLQNVYHDEAFSGQTFSPSFSVMNLQVRKLFRRFEIYAGVENMFDYRQLNPIIHPENPFGNSFDATNIWGPIQGRRIYAGVRITIK